MDKETEEEKHARQIIDTYAEQMAKNYAFKIDTNFSMVVKQKPKWMPSWLYKKVIKELIELRQYK